MGSVIQFVHPAPLERTRRGLELKSSASLKTIGEIEGRFAVLETIVKVCLHQEIGLESRELPRFRQRLRRAIAARCRALRLSVSDQARVAAYAETILADLNRKQDC